MLKYYDLFKAKKEAGDHDLTIATIFSYQANEEDADADGYGFGGSNGRFSAGLSALGASDAPVGRLVLEVLEARSLETNSKVAMAQHSGTETGCMDEGADTNDPTWFAQGTHTWWCLYNTRSFLALSQGQRLDDIL